MQRNTVSVECLDKRQKAIGGGDLENPPKIKVLESR